MLRIVGNSRRALKRPRTARITPQEMADDPSVAAADRKHKTASSRVDAVDCPSRSRHQIEQTWRKDVGRLHLQT